MFAAYYQKFLLKNSTLHTVYTQIFNFRPLYNVLEQEANKNEDFPKRKLKTRNTKANNIYYISTEVVRKA